MTMTSKSFKAGITGGIGAGKSIITRIFAVLGVPVYDADSRAKWLMNHDEELIHQINALFGGNAYVDGALNRKLLSKVAFSDPEKLRKLNGLVHPAVAADYTQWTKGHNSSYTLKEAALLFESGSYKQLDTVIHVSAPEQLRIERVLKRDPHRSLDDIKKIIEKQWPEEKKVELANHIIYNDQSSRVIPQVLTLHQKLLDQVRG